MKTPNRVETLSLAVALDDWFKSTKELLAELKSHEYELVSKANNRHATNLTIIDTNLRNEINSSRLTSENQAKFIHKLADDVRALDSQLSEHDARYKRFCSKHSEDAQSDELILEDDEGLHSVTLLEKVEREYNDLAQRYLARSTTGISDALNYLFSSVRKKDYGRLIQLKTDVEVLVTEAENDINTQDLLRQSNLQKSHEDELTSESRRHEDEVELTDKQINDDYDIAAQRIDSQIHTLLSQDYLSRSAAALKNAARNFCVPFESDSVRDGALFTHAVEYEISDKFANSAIESLCLEVGNEISSNGNLFLPLSTTTEMGLPLYVRPDSNNLSICRDFVTSTILSCISNIQAGGLRIRFCDIRCHGDNAKSLFPLRKASPELFGDGIIVNQTELSSTVSFLIKRIDNLLQNILGNQYISYFEYLEDGNENQEGIELLIIYDFPLGFSNEIIDSLELLATRGYECGIYCIFIEAQPTLLLNADDDAIKATLRIEQCCEVVEQNEMTLYSYGMKRRFQAPPNPRLLNNFASEYKSCVDRVTYERIRREESSMKFDSDHGLTIPFGRTSDGSLACIDFTQNPHAFLAGTTGSGKSVFLHNLILNACKRYSPNDLQIWLIDYKRVEFRIYQNEDQCYPQITFIGTDNTRDFVKAVMEELTAEYARRQELIDNANAHDIFSYNSRSTEKLPFLLILMDEFHRQSAFTGGFGEARDELEFLLKEARSFGMHFLIADQTIGGLYGLSDSARKQLAGRIQLKWAEKSELRDMFEGTSLNDDVINLVPGQALVRYGGGIVLCSTPNLDHDKISDYVSEVKNIFPRSYPLRIHDAKDRSLINPSTYPTYADEFIAIGTRVSFSDPVCTISLSRHARENIFMFNKTSTTIDSLIVTLAYGFLRTRQKGALVLLYPEGYSLLEEDFSEISHISSSHLVKTYIGVAGLCEMLNDGLGQGTLIFAPSLETIIEDCSSYPPKDSFSKSDNTHQSSNMDLIYNYLREQNYNEALTSDNFSINFSNISDNYYDTNTDSSICNYDARTDIMNIIERGGHNDIHLCWISDSIPNLYALFGATTGLKDLPTLFPTRFSTKCTKEEAAALKLIELGSEAHLDEIGDRILMCDRKGKLEVIQPYIFSLSI